MGSTTHERAARTYFESLTEDPAAAAAFAYFRAELRALDGRPETAARINDIGQMFRHPKPHTLPLEQQAVMFEFMNRYNSNWYTGLLIDVGAEPLADSQREENAAALTNLPRPFTAEVDMTQNAGDCDGTLSWDVPIKVKVFTDSETEEWTYAEIQPRTVPLEIGYTMPSRTITHMMGFGVARWPYGTDRICLFLNLDPWRGIGL